MPSKKYTTIEQINSIKPAFSRLTAIEFLPNRGLYLRRVRCVCSCGKITDLGLPSFTSGKTRSCGCYFSEVMKYTFTKYKGSNKTIYCCYKGMWERCYKPLSKAYKNYGGATPPVIVCEEWVNDYQAFLDWALSNGWQKGLQLDKDIKYKEEFPDSIRGLIYSPKYCQFVTAKENRRETSRSVYIEYNGETMLVIDFCEKFKINRDTLSHRIKTGCSVDEAIANPFIKKSRKGVETKATKRYLYKGELLKIGEISAITGIPYRKVYLTYYSGKTIE